MSADSRYSLSWDNHLVDGIAAFNSAVVAGFQFPGGSTEGAPPVLCRPATQQRGLGSVSMRQAVEREVRPPHRGASDGVP